MVLLLACAFIPIQAEQSPSVVLSIGVQSQCSLDVVSSGAGTMTFRYKVRTTRAGGGGAIVATSANANVALTYDVILSGVGSAQSGSDKTVVIFGADARSARQGDTGTITWTPSDEPLTPAISCH